MNQAVRFYELHTQLSCGSAGNSYPREAIDKSVVLSYYLRLLELTRYSKVYRREQSPDQEDVRGATGAAEGEDLSAGGEDLQPGEEVQEGRAGGDLGGVTGGRVAILYLTWINHLCLEVYSGN